MTSASIETERFLLRPWKDSDLEPFAALNADPTVMEFFPKVLSREESDELSKKIIHRLDALGWGLWAVEIPGEAEFIGFIGLNPVGFDAKFTPAVEVGWRLAHKYWGKGYAPEGAAAAIEYGFAQLELNEIVSFTAESNLRSMRVMEKLGMIRDPRDDFIHPDLPADHELAPHVLYRIQRSHWQSQN